MELKEFVSEILVQVCEGIVDAQARTANSGALISPTFKRNNGELTVDTVSNGLTSERFDVALTASTSNSTDGKGGLKLGIAVLEFNAGGGKTEAVQNSQVSRVQFEIPVKLPEVNVF